MSEQTRDKGLAELDLQESAGSPGPLHPKDRVRVTFESNYQDVAIAMWHNTPLMKIATLELLERADDPAKDLIGTVRRSPDGVVAAKSPNPDYPWRGFGEPCGENFATVSVIGWPVIGSVPGTPAADAEKPAGHCASCECLHDECGYVIGSAACEESHPEVSGAGVPYPTADPLSMKVRQRVAELLVSGGELAAVNVAANALGCSLKEAGQLVESLPEYQTYLNHRKVEDVELPTPAARKFRYFSKRNYLLHRIAPDGRIQFRHPDDGWADVVPPNSVNADWLESEWNEVGDVEPIGDAS